MFVPVHPGRTSSSDISALISQDRLILAFIKSENVDLTSPIGSVSLNVKFDKENGVGEFGMLSVKEECAGKGLGN